MKLNIPTPGRWIGLIILWLIYNLGLLVLGLLAAKTHDYRVIIGGGLLLQSFVALIALFALFRPAFRDAARKTIVLLTLGCFFAATQVQAQVKLDPGPPLDDPQPQLLAVCIAVGVVIGIGVGGAYVIYRLCKLLPPPTPPPAPPTPPPLPPAPSTNAPPVTNTAPKAAWSASSKDMPAYDVAAFAWLDTRASAATTYYAWMQDTNLQTSTDLTHWETYTLQAWVSQNGVLTLLLDGHGNPVMTNYAEGNALSGTNLQVQMPFDWAPATKRFFRYNGAALAPAP